MRRYKPEAYNEYGDGMYSDESYACVKMIECRDGGWVPYQNAVDAVKMLTKRIARLEAASQKVKP